MNKCLIDLFEDENKGWSVYGHKPNALDDETWSAAIEYEVMSNYFDFFNLEKLSKKAKNNFEKQKNIILKSFKTIFFDTCPKATIGKSGQIYLFYPYSKDSLYIHTLDSYGELAFVGGGTVCIITPKNENVLYVIYKKLNHDSHIIKEISMAKLDDAIKNGYCLSGTRLQL
jgi:hypothetical protein